MSDASGFPDGTRYFIAQLNPRTHREDPDFGRMAVPPGPPAQAPYRWAIEVARRATELDRQAGGGRKYIAVAQYPRQLTLW